MNAFPGRWKRGFAVLGICLLSAGASALYASAAKGRLTVVPRPAKVEIRPGAFTLGKRTAIHLKTDDSGVRWVGEYLSKLLSAQVGIAIPVRVVTASARDRHAIVLSLKASPELGPEGYAMTVSRGGIQISAPKVAGLFYAVQTLRQLLPPGSASAVKKPLRVPCVRIEDKPRFQWRGFMLDCSRTFLSMAYLRHTVDLMALYKLNVLHLHLTDDQGWRLAIKQYPKLTTLGAHFAERFGGAGGFYTRQQMRRLIAYARRRNITVVPEIEMPGHSGEVLAAYPELACPIPGKSALSR